MIMTQHVLLNSVEHKHIKVNTARSEALGDNLWFCPTFPAEFRPAQTYYPIFFHKDSQTGKFYPITLFGFKDNENLFLNEDGWDAGYIPLAVQRQPFLIGQQRFVEDGVEQIQRVIHIDLDNPRVNETTGEALFLEFGGNTDYLDQVADMLETLHHGMSDAELFVDTLLTLDLIESVNIDVQLNDGSKHQMIGFYTISEETLNQLTGEQLASLHQNGYLQAIYMMIASQTRIRDLLNRKNKRLGL
jgi:hypothetical protein